MPPALIVLLLGIAGADVQGRAPVYPDKMNLMVWRDEQGKEHPVASAEDWQRRRQHALAAMQLVMGPLPSPDRRVPLDVQVLQTEDLPALVRKKITYAAAKDYRVPAYLLVPRARKARAGRPCSACTARAGRAAGRPDSDRTMPATRWSWPSGAT